MNGLATILLGFGLMVLCWPAVRLIPNAAGYLVLLYLCVLASCLRTLCTQFIRARMRNRLVAADGVMTTASLLLFYLLFLSVLNMGATGYLLALFCSDLCSAVFVFVAGGCGKFFDLRKFDRPLWGEMLRYCVPMIPAAIGFWIINASDQFYVQAMCDGVGGRSSEAWVGLLGVGYFLPPAHHLCGPVLLRGVAAFRRDRGGGAGDPSSTGCSGPSPACCSAARRASSGCASR